MTFKNAVVELTEREIQIAVGAYVRQQGYEVIKTTLANHEAGHNGPTAYSAKVEVRPQQSPP